MAYNFPDSPSNGDTFILNGITYAYNSTKGVWKDTAVSPPSVTSSDTAPSTPASGALWYRTDDSTLYVYYSDGSSSQWVGVSGPAGPQGITGADGADGSTAVSDAAPSSPSAGQLWWNSATNKLYIYYTDAHSSQWIQATTPGATGATGPAGTATHQDTWRLSSNVTADANPITAWTNTPASSTYQTTLGTAMTHSGGVFTFPVTGYWKVEFFAKFNLTTSDNINIGINGFDGSTGISTPLTLATVGDSGYVQSLNTTTHINVTNASSSGTRVSFFVSSLSSGNTLQTDSTRDATYVMFTRLADAV